MIPVLLAVLAGQADTSVVHLPSRIALDVGRLGTRRASAFTAAEVLRRHDGWKLGRAAYVGAAYIATSRLSEREHYLTDVVFGAAIGIAAARTPGQTR
jgi:hypothetical protein